MAKWLTILAAAVGLAVGVYTAATSREALPSPPPAQPPSVNPFPSGVAGTGLVEAASRNVRVAAPEAGVVVSVTAQVNDTVKAGDTLFQLDTRLLDAELIQAKAVAAASVAELDRLIAQPRPEDLPPLQAAADQARAEYLNAKDQFDRTSQAVESNAAGEGELNRRRFDTAAADARLHAAQAQLDRAKAGAWEHDIAVARAKVAEAQSRVRAIELRIERLTVNSPIDGTVLKRHVEPGEMTGAPGGAGELAIVVGDLSRLRVRAQIDEADAPLVRPGAAATARVRGRVDALLPLTMVRIEPMAIPKKQLTGAGAELVDTRIVEVLFEVTETKGVAIYPGQIVDVFVDVQETGVRGQETGVSEKR